jgi:SAM-dependent methyltransferase
MLGDATTLPYLHGYGSAEQARLVAQAEHWRNDLIRDGTKLPPGTRLLEVGCGVGAVLAVLGQEFPGVELCGVDIEAEQLRVAKEHLAAVGVQARLVQADASALPFEDACMDHVWMMWFLEHLTDPVAALREARRVLDGNGTITAIEVDYGTCRAEPTTPAIEALFTSMVAGMRAAGHSDAGTRLPGWLRAAGFDRVDEGERPFWWTGDELGRQANYAADVMGGVVPELARLQGAPPESLLRDGINDLRHLDGVRGAGLGWTVHKSTAVK